MPRKQTNGKNTSRRAQDERNACSFLFDRSKWWKLNSGPGWKDPGNAGTTTDAMLDMHKKMTWAGRKEYWRQRIIAAQLKRPWSTAFQADFKRLEDERDADLREGPLV